MMSEQDFTIAEWTDFVRGLTTPSQTRAMEARLVSGDAEAQRIVAALGRVATVGRVDQEQAVPEQAVRIAKALGNMRRATAPMAASSLLHRLAGAITFDSFAAPAVVGTRSLEATERQLTVVAGDYLIDLEVEPPTADQQLGVAGQVVHRRDASRPATKVPVMAYTGQRILGSVETNHFGEFQLATLSSDVERLCLWVEAKTFIEIPLGAAPAGLPHQVPPATPEEES